ncbi:MAG TPA: hypothetical protein VFB38_25420 [Chthonomonadaceae bacterium]|nr:hypothetical protein [Chthonomonadaceae bacterium]
MRLLSFRHLGMALAVSAALAGPGVTGRAAQTQDEPQPQLVAQYPDAGQGYGNAAAVASTLQVTGTADRFTILADHADVRSLLSLVFNQAEKDFTLDNNVAGQVTMRLSRQSFLTVLDAICQQTFLRYTQDKDTGIYHFTRDDEAIRAAFTRLRTLNAQLQAQLRFLGLDLPHLGQNGFAPPAYFGVPGQLGGGFGGFGGGATLNMQRLQQTGPPGPAGPAGPSPQSVDNALTRRQEARVKSAPSSEKETKGEERLAHPAPRRADGRDRLGGANQPTIVPDAAAQQDAYRQLKNQYNYVELYTQPGQSLPVRDAIEQLAAQANVPVLIDPKVPAGPKFRLEGSISARSLPDALNILTSIARLEWKWVGDKIFVTTTPDFQLFYGNTNVPRASYPPVELQQRALKSQARPANPGAESDKKANPKSRAGGKGKKA